MNCALMLSVLVGFLTPFVHGQETDEKKQEYDRWQDYYSDVAEAYEFFLESDVKTKLDVNSKSLLSYSHPTSMKGMHGAFFVWTRRGRPEIIGSIWSEEIQGGKRTVMHELHLLSQETLMPVEIGKHIWKSTKGIAMKPIPKAKTPSDREKIRKIQMRSLSRQFTGFSTPDGGKELQLRMQPEPIYRYESKTPDALGGSVFALFKDWDPEIMLLIEARKTATGAKWFFGAGRFNVSPLRLTHGGTDVWKVDSTIQRYPRFGGDDDVFFAAHLIDQQDAKKSWRSWASRTVDLCHSCQWPESMGWMLSQ